MTEQKVTVHQIAGSRPFYGQWVGSSQRSDDGAVLCQTKDSGGIGGRRWEAQQEAIL